MRFGVAEREDQLPPLPNNYDEDPYSQVFVARDNGEVLGLGAYIQKDNSGVIDYLRVFDKNQGKNVASGLLEKCIEHAEESGADSIYSLDTVLDGKVQHLLQDKEFEASGFLLDNKVSNVSEKPGGGFNVQFWKTDAEVESYLPQEIRNFTNNSLPQQREIDYLQPQNPERATGSLNISRRKNENSQRGNFLSLQVGQGQSLQHHMDEAIRKLEEGDYWAKEVKVDSSEPIAYPVSKSLYERGYRPVNFSPNNELTMMDLDVVAGEYRLTPETRQLLEETGINFEVVEEDELSDTINFLPG